MSKDIQEIFDHYIEAVLITEQTEGSEGDDEYESHLDFAENDITIHTVNKETKEKVITDITRFLKECGDLLTEWPETQIGHDFWLTRCGHGEGFLTRTEYPNGDAINNIIETKGFETLGGGYVHIHNKELCID